MDSVDTISDTSEKVDKMRREKQKKKRVKFMLENELRSMTRMQTKSSQSAWKLKNIYSFARTHTKRQRLDFIASYCCYRTLSLLFYDNN